MGVTLTSAEIAKLLSKMCLKSKAMDADRIEVRFTPHRSNYTRLAVLSIRIS